MTNKATTPPLTGAELDKLEALKYTLGPWELDGPEEAHVISEDYHVIKGGCGYLAEAKDEREPGFRIAGHMTEADARLISVAPGLINTLRKMHNEQTVLKAQLRFYRKLAETALAQARAQQESAAAPMLTQQAFEEIAQSWDGCRYDDAMIDDIGAALRRDFDRLAAPASAQLAEAAFYWFNKCLAAGHAVAPSDAKDAERLNALHAAVSALYFDDSSDFRSALGAVIRHLDHELAGEMLGSPKAAYDKVCAAIAATQQAAPVAGDAQ